MNYSNLLEFLISLAMRAVSARGSDEERKRARESALGVIELSARAGLLDTVEEANLRNKVYHIFS
jgi:hypothetical protein